MVVCPSVRAQLIQTEPNDSIPTATDSTLTAGSSGGVFSIGNNGDGPFGPTTGNGTGDFDFFSVAANAGQVIVFDVNSNIDGTAVDSLIGIYNSAGTLLASNDDDGISRDSYLRFTAVADDTYFLAVGNWIPGAASDAESLPTNLNAGGTGRGAPGGGVDEYEVVITLDGEVYLSYDLPVFPVGGAAEVVEGEIFLYNEGNSLATITALNITGPDAAKFSTDQTLPLTIGPGAGAFISVNFNPGGSDAFASAVAEIVSNDIVHPTLTLPLEAKAIEGLLFRLPFDDPAGSTTGGFGVPAETSGNNFDAAMIVNAGAAPPVFGRPSLVGGAGFSTQFNDSGSSGNFVLTGNGFPHTATFTYSVWVRPTAGAGDDTLFNRDPGFGLGDSIYGCTIGTSGEVVFRISGVDVVLSDLDLVPDDSVHHIVVTHLDSTGFGDFLADRTRLYIDGALISENTETFEVPEYSGETNSRLWIGTRSAAGTGFNGDMDDFQLYNVELTPDQVAGMFDDPGSIAGDARSASLQITGFERSGDGSSVNITFNSRSNRTYSVQASDDLAVWDTVDSGIESAGSSTTTVFADPGVFTEETKKIFFRIIEE